MLDSCGLQAKRFDRHWLAIDLGQELNRQSILDILQIDAALNMRRAVPDERLDNGALVIGISDGLGNVGTEPGPNKVGGIGRIGRSASKMMSSISRGLIAPPLGCTCTDMARGEPRRRWKLQT